MSERLQKCISIAGICSRRQAEAWIAEGRVTVNGAPAVLGQRVDPERDTICVDGKAITPANEELVYIMLNKPRGYVCTVKDEQGRKSVMDLVQGEGHRLYPVGRLDMFSQGLLLMTNDGALTKALTHPSHDVKKEYQVRVVGDVDAALPILRGPMSLDGKPLKPCRIRVLKKAEDSSLLLFAISVLFSFESRPDDPMKKRLIRSAIYAVVVGGALYLLYVTILKTQLPTGALWKLFR